MYCKGNDFSVKSVFGDGNQLTCRVIVVDLKDVGGAKTLVEKQGTGIREDKVVG